MAAGWTMRPYCRRHSVLGRSGLADPVALVYEHRTGGKRPVRERLRSAASGTGFSLAKQGSEHMASVHRRILLAAPAALAAPALLMRKANAAEFTYKYANNLPATHPMNVHAQEAVAKIKEKTAGKVEIRIFPNNQLGSDTDVLSQVRSGAVEFFTLSGLILSTLVPSASINGVGFAFSDYDTVWRAMDGALGAFVRA
jgi:hypothetical protein